MVKYFLAAFLLCSFTLIYAQETQDTSRSGFVFGSSFGAAVSFNKFPGKTENCGGVALDLKLGYMINPDLAILLTTNTSSYDYEGTGRARQRDFGVLAPAVQYWLNNKFWILGGIGLGGDAPIFWDIKNPKENKEETKYYNGFGAVAAFGYEVYQDDGFVLDVKLKLTYRNVDLQEGNTTGLSTAILFGVNFY